MREFLKSFFSFGVATSIEKILAFILLPIYTRLFTTTEYGMIDLCQVLMGIVSVFALLQLETSLQRYYYKWEGDDKKSFVQHINYGHFIIVFFLNYNMLVVILYFQFAFFQLCLLFISYIVCNPVAFYKLFNAWLDYTSV